MTKYKLDYFNHTFLEFIENDEIIIWINHSKDYRFGSYYKITKDKKVLFCVEKPNEYYEITLKEYRNDCSK